MNLNHWVSFTMILKLFNIMCDWNDILKEYQLFLIDFNCYNKNNGDNLCGGHSFAFASPTALLSKMMIVINYFQMIYGV